MSESRFFHQDFKGLLEMFLSPESWKAGFYFSCTRNRLLPMIADLCFCNVPAEKMKNEIIAET